MSKGKQRAPGFKAKEGLGSPKGEQTVAAIVNRSSPGFVGTLQLMKERVFHAENEEPVPDRIEGTVGRSGAHRSCC